MVQTSKGTDLLTFPVRLTRAYLFTATVERSSVEDPASRVRTFDPSVRVVSIEDGGKDLTVVLGVKVTNPFREAGVLAIDCSVAGHFLASRKRAKSYWERFAKREAVALLWPYLRSYAGQLAQMTGLDVPPLPTLDVASLLARIDAATGGVGHDSSVGSRRNPAGQRTEPAPART